MLSSNIRPSTNSPIGTVPYDVLLEIFVHCLPQDRFSIDESKARIAPMLLCHICSSWRMVALANPILWTHLSFSLEFTLLEKANEEQRNWGFLQNEIEFIQWWKKNQGAIPPFLHLQLSFNTYFESGHVMKDGMAFLMKYVTSAQHLEIDPLFWTDGVGPLIAAGDQFTFPNLHTLVMCHTDYDMETSDLIAIQALIGRASSHIPSILRRLVIVESDTLSQCISIPIQWLSLTHLSISTSDLSLSFWIPVTSAISCLQWAFVSFDSISNVDEHVNPIQRTLPHLSALYIESCDEKSCLIGPLFIGLHLPTLDTFLLSSLVDEWLNDVGMPDIYTILQSAPALSKLTLQKHEFLLPSELDYSTGAIGNVALRPIWHYAPHLVHLQLALYISDESEMEKEWAVFARSAFISNNRWLDLDNSACPIKTITVIDQEYDRRFETPRFRFQTCAGNATNIVFRFPSEPYTYGTSSYLADLWKTWHSGNKSSANMAAIYP